MRPFTKGLAAGIERIAVAKGMLRFSGEFAMECAGNRDVRDQLVGVRSRMRVMVLHASATSLAGTLRLVPNDGLEAGFVLVLAASFPRQRGYYWREELDVFKRVLSASSLKPALLNTCRVNSHCLCWLC